MAAFVQTPAIKKVNDELITKAIADMIVTDYVPPSIVEGEGFNRLMNIVAPGYKVPTRKTVRSRIQQRYDTEKEKLCDELNDVTSTAITTDTWTSNSTESYITVTEHHIDDEWEMKSNFLMTRAMPERHTGENLATRLTDCVEEFNLQGIIISLSDMHSDSQKSCVRIRIFEYIRIVHTNIRIPISVFVPIPTKFMLHIWRQL